MDKECKCGRKTEVQMRTVLYRMLVTVEQVPVFYCRDCDHHEVNPLIKEHLLELVEQAFLQIAVEGEERMIAFSQHNEIAAVLHNSLTSSQSLQHMFEKRIDELLDTLLLARSLKDNGWIVDTERRLSQLAPVVASV